MMVRSLETADIIEPNLFQYDRLSMLKNFQSYLNKFSSLSCSKTGIN